MMAKGCWYLFSKKDQRWNYSEDNAWVGGFEKPNGVDEKIEELKKLYGEPPDDLEWGYMKD
jgi:hypothetical protein